jgi:hypothetical protein
MRIDQRLTSDKVPGWVIVVAPGLTDDCGIHHRAQRRADPEFDDTTRQRRAHRPDCNASWLFGGLFGSADAQAEFRPQRETNFAGTRQ